MIVDKKGPVVGSTKQATYHDLLSHIENPSSSTTIYADHARSLEQ